MTSPAELTAQLRSALEHPNVQAFLRVVRAGESHATDFEAYTALYGWKPGNGQTITNFADHPRRAFKSPWGWTSAAGAYQAMCAVQNFVRTDTWGDFIRACGPSDFSPAQQDLFAAWCIQRRHALADVLAGRVVLAIDKCNEEWASLPGAPYGQPTRTLDQALATYAAHGGFLANGTAATPVATAAAVPAPPGPVIYTSTKPPLPEPVKPTATHTTTTATPTTGASDMLPLLPFIAAALPSLIEAAPGLIRIFGNSPQAEKNAKAAEAVAEIAKTVTGQPTVEGAVTAIDADPAVAAQFREQIHVSMGELLGMMERVNEMEQKNIGAARMFNHDEPLFLDTTWVKVKFIHLLSLVFVGFSGYFVQKYWGDLTPELRGAVITLMIIAGWNGVRDYWMGSSSGSDRKTTQILSERQQ